MSSSLSSLSSDEEDTYGYGSTTAERRALLLNGSNSTHSGDPTYSLKTINSGIIDEQWHFY